MRIKLHVILQLSNLSHIPPLTPLIRLCSMCHDQTHLILAFPMICAFIPCFPVYLVFLLN